MTGPVQCSRTGRVSGPVLAIKGRTLISVCFASARGAPTSEFRHQCTKSAHFWTSVVPAPQGSIGTLDVEFFGEPSTSLSL
jgi:hypothetical protein